MADFMADLGGLTDPTKAQSGAAHGDPLGSSGSATQSSRSKGWGPGPVRLSSWRKVWLCLRARVGMPFLAQKTFAKDTESDLGGIYWRKAQA
eukprot:1158266-Pelagomonas_calceolata.AAC.7